VHSACPCVVALGLVAFAIALRATHGAMAAHLTGAVAWLAAIALTLASVLDAHLGLAGRLWPGHNTLHPINHVCSATICREPNLRKTENMPGRGKLS
jgi:predicted transporter